jgi:adenine-specific DNA-methyltransferase
VKVVHGPWGEAIRSVRTLAPDESVLVYVDAPYKRDEYSRYYHVLETLATYEYPEVRSGGLLPVRGDGGRFASEFSTRSAERVADALARVISASLENGWRVAWSYSNDADTTIQAVLSQVSAPIATCTAISAPHRYRRQGRASESRNIREYLVLIEPQRAAI